MRHYDVAIIGSGFAGAASAFFLARAGLSTLVLEQESQPGLHASGKNAAIGRQFSVTPWLLPYTRKGIAFLHDPPAEVAQHPLIRTTGSLLLLPDTREPNLGKHVAAAHAVGINTTIIRKDECTIQCAALANYAFDSALWTPTDGVIDIHAYLGGLLQGARQHGAVVVTKARVDQLQWDGVSWQIGATSQSWSAGTMVNAAGAWAETIAALAGARSRELVPMRRHLFVTEPMETVETRWPPVWDLTHDFYFRPESGGLLLCACDETATHPDDQQIDAGALELLYTKMQDLLPHMAQVRIAHQWSGLRTFAPSRQFVIERDERAPQFVWAAGLGGHGVTCAAAVGEEVARLVSVRGL